MSSTRNIELSHRPSNRDKYTIIIPAAGLGRRMKTYGPKSLTPLTHGTILSRQLKLIYESFNYSEVILVGGFEIDKLAKNLDDKVKLVYNENYETTNVLHSIHLGLRKVKTDRVLVVYGDLVFNKQCVYLPFHGESGIVVADGMKDEEVGCIFKNNILENIYYGLSNKWAQIAYFTGLELELLKTISEKNPDWFGFEAINQIITLGGNFKVFLPKYGQASDIDSTYDLKKLDENFNQI